MASQKQSALQQSLENACYDIHVMQAMLSQHQNGLHWGHRSTVAGDCVLDPWTAVHSAVQLLRSALLAKTVTGGPGRLS